jgi:hypothetical protein
VSALVTVSRDVVVVVSIGAPAADSSGLAIVAAEQAALPSRASVVKERVAGNRMGTPPICGIERTRGAG